MKSSAGERIIVGTAIAALTGVAMIVVLGSSIAPHDYTEIRLDQKLLPPVFRDGGSWEHIFGTDELGRDLWSRMIAGTQTSMQIALSGAILGAILGIGLGVLAAYSKGVVEHLIMMLVDVQSALPYLVFALATLAALGSGVIATVIVVGFATWPRYARLTRAMLLAEQEKGYTLAARSIGLPSRIIYRRHLLPNIVGILIVQFATTLPLLILLETSLSFLGLGVQYPNTSLGSILGAGRDFLLIAPWIAIYPGLMITTITLSISILGDWTRDRLDPSLV